MQLEKRHLDAYPSLSTWMKLLWLFTWLVCGGNRAAKVASWLLRLFASSSSWQ